MAVELDQVTLERLRSASPREVLEEARRLAWGLPSGTDSASFLEILEAFVAAGLITWAQVDALDDGGR